MIDLNILPIFLLLKIKIELTAFLIDNMLTNIEVVYRYNKSGYNGNINYDWESETTSF